ncbi:molybdopterin biosynthesis protein moea [hydrocarbon metagenome]|uniref:Molybdopterin biosynthesis protein moea n=1 Tax=hydrocarbon metagenome TaxID=938273 RepID=A0A0W8E562_9ZZZZ
MNSSIRLEDAVASCRKHVHPVENEHISLETASQRISARDIAAEFHVPGFDRSAVDGFAVCRIDLFKINSDQIGPLQVISELPAGSSDDIAIDPGETVKIMTGAILPAGTAAVFKQEHVEQCGNIIYPGRKIRQGENIQKAGSEIPAGKQLVKRGEVLDSERIERIACCGAEKVSVHRIPRIYIINTGNELVLPGIPLQRGQIYHSNRSLLSAKIVKAGGAPLFTENGVKDDRDAIADEIIRGTSCSDMVIISGGTGHGTSDLVYDSLQKLGAELLFKGIDIIPGKGAAAAVHNGRLIYNLAGNPGAVSLLFEVLIKPAVLTLKGASDGLENWFDIKLHRPIKKISDRRSLRRAEMIFMGQGYVVARPLDEANSFCSEIPLILDLKPGQGKQGDVVRAMMI